MPKAALKVELSIRAYAVTLKVSEGAVRKAIKEGKFKFGYNATTKKIDPIKAARNHWVTEQNLEKPKPGKGRQKILANMQKREPQTSIRKTANEDDDTEDDDGADATVDELLASIKITGSTSAATAMKYNEIINAALNKKKLEEQHKILVKRVEVDKTLFAFGNELKKAMQNIPQRVAREMMSCTNEVEAINILLEEINDVLNNYGNLQSY